MDAGEAFRWVADEWRAGRGRCPVLRVTDHPALVPTRAGGCLEVIPQEPSGWRVRTGSAALALGDRRFWVSAILAGASWVSDVREDYGAVRELPGIERVDAETDAAVRALVLEILAPWLATDGNSGLSPSS